MRKAIISVTISILCGSSLSAQQSAASTQTARQALMEMFFSKTPGTFVKHLPAVTRAALEKSGALAGLQQYSLLATQIQTQQQNVQTFETGSVMLSGEDPKTGQKVEIIVENDALRGDQDDIGLSFQMYKNGQVQRTPFMPQLTFSMKMEAQLWTLSEISLTLHLPLADPDLLKAVTEKLQPQASASVTFTPRVETSVASHVETPAQSAATDAQVVSAMRTILMAEVTYATTYPTVGFTCMLSDLDGFGGGERNEHQAMLINSGLASGKKYGFVFMLSECSGAPARGFHLTTAPNGYLYGRKAFCSDQSGVIRSSQDGTAATCLASGTPIP